MHIFFLIVSISILDAQEKIEPIPLNVSYDKEKALLGKKLFHDTRLSKDNTVACVSCHLLNDGGDDNLQYSFGINAQEGKVNSPTVFNARYNFVQFWDGRAKDLKTQAAFPIKDPIEMDSSLEAVVTKLLKDEYYKTQFSALYKDGMSKENLLDAIAEFEKALVTPNARFDKYLRGDATALTEEEKEGYVLFRSDGCISCHNGVNIGSNLFQKVGVLKEYKGDKNMLGRYNVTKKEKDKYFFKVPTLRNIALTSPYLHDGSKKTLEGVVRFMMVYQLGIIPDPVHIKKIVAFLKTLNGEIPKIAYEKSD